MKNIRCLLYTFLCFVLLTFIVCLFLSSLYFFQLINLSFTLISKTLGFIIWMICGYLLGKNIKERTFFYALGFSLFMFLICFIFVEKNIINIFILFCKSFLFIGMALIGRK